MSNAIRLTAAISVLTLWPNHAQGAQCIRLDFGPSPLARILVEARDRQLTLTCPRCPIRPEIDGNLDDEAWKTAATLETVGMTTAPTSARICFDDEAIYIAVRCTEKPGRTPRGEARPRDGELWGDDHVEIWITPPGAKMTKYQFVVSIAGSIFDLKDGRTGYNPDWTQAVRRQKDGWVVETAIPYRALELAGPVGRLGFNVGRNGPGLTLQCWNGTYGDTSKSVILLDGIAERGEQAAQTDTAGSRQVATSGSGLNVHLERAYARPGERWIEAKIGLQPSVDLGSSRLRAKLFELAGEAPIATTSIAPPRRDGWLLVDLRSKALTAAEVSLELIEKERRIGAAKLLLSAQPCTTPLRRGRKIRALIDVPSGMGHVRAWPVTFGVPFPPGALWDTTKLRAVDGDGKPIPCQTETTGLWAREGSAKWVRFDALVSSEKGCFVEVLDGAEHARPATPLSVSEEGDAIVIETGASRYVLGKGTSPIREAHRKGRLVASNSGTRGLYVIDQRGRVASASAEGETMRIEVRGPVAACVRFEGPYRTADGETLARHITRVECSAGIASARITHTLVLTNDTYEVWFKDVGWELSVTPGDDAVAAFAASRSDWQKVTSRPLRDARAIYMLQDRHYCFAHGKNHFAIAAVGADGQEEVVAEGEECGDWALLLGGTGGLAMGCREAARQHPTEFEVRQDRMALHLFSGRAGDELDFRPATLVRKWDLETWQSKATWKSGQIKDLAKKAAEYQVNAIGWAKTHELCFLPLLPDDSIQGVARTMKLHSDLSPLS